MRLTAWQKFWITVKIRWKIKREFFTLVIPVIIALFLLFIVIHDSLLAYNQLGTGAYPLSTNSVNLTKQQLLLILAGNASALSSVKAPDINAEKQTIDIVLVAIPIIALAPYSIDITLAERRSRKYQEDFASFLFELSELVRGGIDPIKAFRSLASGNVGSITKFCQVCAKQMEIGYSFEESMKNLGNLIGDSLVKNYIDLVVQASYSGGSVSGLIQKAAADMNTFISIDKEKRSGLSQYTMILYTGQVVLIALSAILVIQFIPSLNALGSIGGAGLTGILGSADIGKVTIERDLFYLVLINGALGGLVIGKISEGKIRHGFKHSLILILIALIAWSLFVTPVKAGPVYSITPVSYSLRGTAGLPMDTQFAVRVTDQYHNPINNTLVSFTITGGGHVDPTSGFTDSNGTVSTIVYLGGTPGIDVLTATAGSASISIPIQSELSGD